MSDTTKSIAKGVSILGITGIVNKVIGVLYSIPLARILGDTGLGLFQTVYPTYNLFLTISSAGLPVAVSRLVSHYLAKQDPRNAKRTFQTALALLVTIGTFFSVLMLVANGLLVRIVGVEEASGGFYAIAPCVAIVCALSAFRGFMQGQQNMVPTAISQVIEQVGKVVVSLPLAALGDPATAPARALMGITCVEGLALLYMLLLHRKKQKAFDSIPQLSADWAIERRDLASRLIAISIPITVSACIIPLSSFIDSALMVNRMVSSGLAKQTATALYGIFSGMVIRLINIPTALALAVSMSLVPAISAVKALEDQAAIRSESVTGIRYAFFIGFPCSVGMSLLSYEIIAFFYQETLKPERLQIAAELLTFSALTVVLFTVVQATSSILQGLHRQRIPMYTMIAGVLCKILLNYILIGTPGINIHGGPIASIVCYTVALVPNLIACCKHAKMPFAWKEWLLRPGFAALVMGLVVYGLKTMLPTHRLITIAEICIGIGVYLVVSFLNHAITVEDLRAITGRRRKRK